MQKEAGLRMALWMPGRASGMLPKECEVFMTQISRKTCTINPVMFLLFFFLAVPFIS